MSVLSEEKQCRERSQRFHFKSSEGENAVGSVVRYFILVVVKWNSVVIEVRDFILIVVKVKQRSERNQRFPSNSSEVKQRSECSQWRKTL